MDEVKGFEEGQVVIVSSSQAGTIIQIDSSIWVFLANSDIWVGTEHEVRFPQDQADLDACPLNVERLEKPLIRVDKQRD